MHLVVETHWTTEPPAWSSESCSIGVRRILVRAGIFIHQALQSSGGLEAVSEETKGQSSAGRRGKRDEESPTGRYGLISTEGTRRSANTLLGTTPVLMSGRLGRQRRNRLGAAFHQRSDPWLLVTGNLAPSRHPASSLWAAVAEGRTQTSQDEEEEEPYTWKTKTSTWKHEEIPDLLVMRADAGVDELHTVSISCTDLQYLHEADEPLLGSKDASLIFPLHHQPLTDSSSRLADTAKTLLKRDVTYSPLFDLAAKSHACTSSCRIRGLVED
ncbi:unnamed protein product [Pleuronectes platessa]|uniref:Uncharacterized protein n=1 Tax=Pleuronectes platessa TaxID=8262 RepID=A0A9N7ZDG1_PLEPL|nr:unnamed protein product [Pleuronectes platessa]